MGQGIQHIEYSSKIRLALRVALEDPQTMQAFSLANKKKIKNGRKRKQKENAQCRFQCQLLKMTFKHFGLKIFTLIDYCGN